MGLRGRKPKSLPPVVQAQGLDGLQLRLRELDVQRRAVVAQIIPLENAGVIVPEGNDSPGRKRAAAVDLLNGAAAPFLAKQPELNSGETLKALRVDNRDDRRGDRNWLQARRASSHQGSRRTHRGRQGRANAPRCDKFACP